MKFFMWLWGKFAECCSYPEVDDVVQKKEVLGEGIQSEKKVQAVRLYSLDRLSPKHPEVRQQAKGIDCDIPFDDLGRGGAT